ncbi:MAG: MscL family protein [Thermoplasmata archaeon]
MGILSDFKAFVMKGTLVSLAVAFVVGLAIVALITALVTDVIDPLIGVFGGVSFDSLWAPTVNGSQFFFGSFVGAVITFLILMAVVFFLIVEPVAAAEKRREARKAKEPDTMRECPYCISKIPVKATRCSFCTSAVTPTVPAVAPAT